MKTVMLALVAGFIFFGVVGCDPPGKPDIRDRFVHPEKVKDTTKLFSKYCAGCHGADGKNGPAPPLNDPLYLALYSDEELLMILEGGRGQMPPFLKGNGGQLLQHQLNAIIHGDTVVITDADKKVIEEKKVKGLRNGLWGNKPAKLDDSYLRKNTGNGDAKAGLDVFRRTCANCHGSTPKSKAGPLNDTDATLALMSEEVLHRLIITGRPDLGMPSYDKYANLPGGKLSPKDVANLWALLKQWKTTAGKSWATTTE